MILKGTEGLTTKDFKAGDLLWLSNKEFPDRSGKYYLIEIIENVRLNIKKTKEVKFETIKACVKNFEDKHVTYDFTIYNGAVPFNKKLDEDDKALLTAVYL